MWTEILNFKAGRSASHWACTSMYTAERHVVHDCHRHALMHMTCTVFRCGVQAERVSTQYTSVSQLRPDDDCDPGAVPARVALHVVAGNVCFINMARYHARHFDIYAGYSNLVASKGRLGLRPYLPLPKKKKESDLDG